MDVITILNDEKEFEVPESLLTNMMADDYDAWLEIARKGRITERLLKNLQKCLFRYFPVIRSLGLEKYDLSDEELEKIIDRDIVFLCCGSDSLKLVLEEAFDRKRRTTLKQAIKENIQKNYQETQGD